MNIRGYQREARRTLIKKVRRMFALLWERQAGKSTTLADMALYEMMSQRNRTCVYASASLLLGREIILKQVQKTDVSARELIEKESKVLFDSVNRFTSEAAQAKMQVKTADASKDKTLDLSLDDFTELFEAQRLEFRVYHDRNSYSRTQVIAPNVATARGWSGTVFLDEIGFIPDFRELWIAIEPIISTNPEFKLIMSTTPPQDDTHYCFELLSAPAGLDFPANPNGNWYESEAGISVHRADCYDTAAAGKKIYDIKSGVEISVEEFLKRSINKRGTAINHKLYWLLGGTAACGLLELKTAQERGIGKCRCFEIESDLDFVEALNWIAEHLHPTNATGIGLDVATTTKKKSNPSVLSIVDKNGVDVFTGPRWSGRPRIPRSPPNGLKRSSIFSSIVPAACRGRWRSMPPTRNILPKLEEGTCGASCPSFWSWPVRAWTSLVSISQPIGRNTWAINTSGRWRIITSPCHRNNISKPITAW
jgi:hypothetical protein